jgi:transcriptional regulator with XRE-family HTH domain
MTPTSHIYLDVKRLRLLRGLTQVQLAKLSRVPQETISRIEARKHGGVDFGILERLAGALDVHPRDLIRLDRASRPTRRRR